MAAIVINYDTVDKTLKVSIDGKVQKDVASVNIYNYKNYDGDEEGHIEVTQIESNEENGISKRTCIYAGHQETILEPILNTEKLSENISKAMRLRS